MRWLLLLSGCAGTAEQVPWIYEADEAERSVDLAVVEAALVDWRDLLFSVQAAPVLDAYDDAMSHGDELCPSAYGNYSDGYWFNNCESYDGARFDGYAFHQDQTVYAETATQAYRSLSGVAVVDVPDGPLFQASGVVYDSLYEDVTDGRPVAFYQSIVRGTFDYPDADGWNAKGLAPDIDLGVYADFGLGYRDVRVGGGISGFSGEVNTVVAEGLFFRTALSPGQCAVEPAGTIAARLSDGSWVDIVFDDVVEQAILDTDSACDGCGRAFYQGERVGKVCLDLSPLLSWEGAPW